MNIWVLVLIAGVILTISAFAGGGDGVGFMGLILIVISIIMMRFSKKNPKIDDIATSMSKNYAQKQLLKYKELYDKGILSKEEYDKKATELKRKILE